MASTRLSELLGLLDGDCVERVTNTLELYDLPVVLRRPLQMDRLLDAMQRDKKVRGGKLRFVVMEELGRAVTTDNVTTDFVVKALKSISVPVFIKL